MLEKAAVIGAPGRGNFCPLGSGCFIQKTQSVLCDCTKIVSKDKSYLTQMADAGGPY